MTECPSEELMARYAAGACDEGASALVRSHLATCPKCADWIADAEAAEAILPDVRAAMDAHIQASPKYRLAGCPPGNQVRLPAGIIDGYELREELGHGGMAVVYLARQALPERDVAIKVMDAGAASRSGLRRFRYESQVLARLSHPNIAQVYEVGTVELERAEGALQGNHGRLLPFFVMEYVLGAESIISHADNRRLDIRARLGLFLQACDAVQHGHQKGVIHRDLKPSNILVDAEGRVKVIDFGVARSTDSDIAATTMQTDVGQIIGTLQYMSPEQCEADPLGLDTRTDVYSLGIVLYELLLGRRPYDVSKTNLYAATRVIREQAALPPRTVDRRIRRDLETIILKAIEKDRAKRYASISDFSADIRRYLNHEPIQARPPTAWTRGVCWAGRHPIVSAAAACVLISALMTAGASVGIWWWSNTRPGRITVDEDWRCARLVSTAGWQLHMWPPDAKPGEPNVTDAVLANRPEAMGGGKLAIVGYHEQSRSEVAGHLCAYDIAGDRETPVWQDCMRDEDLPKDQRDRGCTGWQCAPNQLFGADIFSGFPGDEIVGVFNNGIYSQRAIRIYDINGQLLYQVWQDGGVGRVCWLPNPCLLVFTGYDERVKEAMPVSSAMTAPLGVVVFAIQPFSGQGAITTGYLERQPYASRQQPVWYKYLHPLVSGSIFRFELVPRREHGRETAVLLRGWLASEPRCSFSFIIDETGNEVPDSRKISDEYKGRPRQENEPNPDEFHLSNERPLPADAESSSLPPPPPGSVQARSQ